VITPLTLLRHVTLTDPLSGRAGPGDVFIADRRIAAIRLPDEPPLPLPAEASSPLLEVVDARGLLALPGLVDAHVHLTGGGGESGFRSRVPRQQLSDLVRAGVTTAVGVLGTDGITRTMRDLIATTLGLREEGLSAFCYTGNYAVPVVTLTGSVRDDIAFCDPIVGVGELALSDHRSSQPTLDELLRIASDAYVAGLASGKAGIVHLHLGDGPRGLDLLCRALAIAELPARLFQPTHLNRNPRLFAEARALCAKRRAADLPQPAWDLTAFPAEDCTGETLSAAEAALIWWREGLPMDCLSVSSDGGGCLPTFDDAGHLTHMGVGRATTLLETLRALVDAGMPLHLAAPLVTATPARNLGLPAKGRLVAGADADIVLLDPSLGLSAVIAGGRFLYRNGALWPAGRGTFEKDPP